MARSACLHVSVKFSTNRHIIVYMEIFVTRPKYQLIYYLNVAGIIRIHVYTKQRKYNNKQKNI